MSDANDTAKSAFQSLAPSMTEPAAIRWGAITAIAIVLSVTSGLFGLGFTIVIGGLWIVLPTLYTVAIAQLLYALFVAPAGLVGILGALLLALPLVAEFQSPTGTSPPFRTLGAFVIATIAFTGLFYATSPLGGLAIAGLVFAGLAYGAHRYERLQLGFLEEETQNR